MADNPNSILNLDSSDFLFALDELGIRGDERDRLLSAYDSQRQPAPRPSVPDDRSFGYHLLDNLVGFDDDFETRGERFRSGARDVASAALDDPRGFVSGAVRGAAEGTYDLIDRGMRGEATPAEMLELAAMPATGALGGIRRIVAGSEPLYDPTTASMFGSRGTKVPEAQQAMDMAEQMDIAGASADEIWKATGETYGYPAFFLPGMSDPLFEFSDMGFGFSDPLGMAVGDTSALRGRTGDVIVHDELFRHYPEVGEAQTNLAANLFVPGHLGEANVNTGDIFVSDNIPLAQGLGAGIPGVPNSSRPEIAGHELQHSVAVFDPSVPQGTNSSYTTNRYNDYQSSNEIARARLNNFLEREEDALDPLRRRLTGGEGGLRDTLRGATEQYAQHIKDLGARVSGSEPLPEGYGSDKFGYGMYTRTPGEALARLTAYRLGMMQDSRIADPASRALRDLEGLDVDALTEVMRASDVPGSFGLEAPFSDRGLGPADVLDVYRYVTNSLVPSRLETLRVMLENRRAEEARGLPLGKTSSTELIEEFRDMLRRDAEDQLDARSSALGKP